MPVAATASSLEGAALYSESVWNLRNSNFMTKHVKGRQTSVTGVREGASAAGASAGGALFEQYRSVILEPSNSVNQGYVQRQGMTIKVQNAS